MGDILIKAEWNQITKSSSHNTSWNRQEHLKSENKMKQKLKKLLAAFKQTKKVCYPIPQTSKDFS